MDTMTFDEDVTHAITTGLLIEAAQMVDAALDNGLIDEETYKSYEELIRKARQKSAQVVQP